MEREVERDRDYNKYDGSEESTPTWGGPTPRSESRVGIPSAMPARVVPNSRHMRGGNNQPRMKFQEMAEGLLQL